MIFYLEKTSLLSASAISTSGTYSFIKPWGPAAINALGGVLPFFKNMFTELENFFSTIK
jgi:membrane protein required for colicin V production